MNELRKSVKDIKSILSVLSVSENGINIVTILENEFLNICQHIKTDQLNKFMSLFYKLTTEYLNISESAKKRHKEFHLGELPFMKVTKCNDHDSNFEIQSDYWMRIMISLAGMPPERWNSDEDYRMREEMKRYASHNAKSDEAPGAIRAPYWLLWCYSHWHRATDNDFYIDYKNYLSAWLHSVAIPQLHISNGDLVAIEKMTGVFPAPHPCFPVGHTEPVISKVVKR